MTTTIECSSCHAQIPEARANYSEAGRVCDACLIEGEVHEDLGREAARPWAALGVAGATAFLGQTCSVEETREYSFEVAGRGMRSSSKSADPLGLIFGSLAMIAVAYAGYQAWKYKAPTAKKALAFIVAAAVAGFTVWVLWSAMPHSVETRW